MTASAAPTLPAAGSPACAAASKPLDGRLHVRSPRGGGAVIEARLPLRESDELAGPARADSPRAIQTVEPDRGTWLASIPVSPRVSDKTTLGDPLTCGLRRRREYPRDDMPDESTLSDVSLAGTSQRRAC
jgi:hypothetical protein